MGKPPAGWYDNPEGPGERYWDGDAWTDDHRSGAPRRSHGGGRIAAIAGTLLVVMTVCVGLTGDDEPPAAQQEQAQAEQEKPERKGDLSARLACDHFRNVSRDVADGVLIGLELRRKLHEIDRESRGSGVSAVRLASRNMLSAYTAQDEEAFGEAVDDMDRACTFLDR